MEDQATDHAITFEQTQRAEELLEEYARVYCSGQVSTTGMRGMAERPERQFYLGMKAQVRRCQGSSKELGELFQEAVELTVPESEQKSLDELVLSIRELNLMLEAEYGRGEGERPERCLEALDYLEKRHFDRVGRGKVYPKAVYFLCRCILDRKASSDGLFQEEWDEARLLKYCDKALDILRDIRRMYYFWEILVIREKLLKQKTRSGKRCCHVAGRTGSAGIFWRRSTRSPVYPGRLLNFAIYMWLERHTASMIWLHCGGGCLG